MLPIRFFELALVFLSQLFLYLFPLVLQNSEFLIKFLVHDLKLLNSVDLLLMFQGEDVDLGGQVLLHSAHLHLPIDVLLLKHQALLTELGDDYSQKLKLLLNNCFPLPHLHLE